MSMPQQEHPARSSASESLLSTTDCLAGTKRVFTSLVRSFRFAGLPLPFAGRAADRRSVDGATPCLALALRLASCLFSCSLMPCAFSALRWVKGSSPACTGPLLSCKVMVTGCAHECLQCLADYCSMKDLTPSIVCISCLPAYTAMQTQNRSDTACRVWLFVAK